MKTKVCVASLIGIVLVLSACGKNDPHEKNAVLNPPQPASVASDSAARNAGETVYDQNSWKTIIPDTCGSFFDGCNNCRRAADSEMAACTKKMCMKYQKPRCLDNYSSGGTGGESENKKDKNKMDKDAMQSSEVPQLKTESTRSSMAQTKGPRAYEYLCGEGSFKVFYNEYVADDQRVKLKNDQIMFSDAQTHTTSLLVRVPSGSGTKYSNDTIEFFVKGDEALVSTNSQKTYTECKKLAITL